MPVGIRKHKGVAAKTLATAIILGLSVSIILLGNIAGDMLAFAMETSPEQTPITTEPELERPETVHRYRNGMVSAGLYHTVMVNEKGNVFTWGDNSYGQLGTGSFMTEESPVKVEGVTDVIAVATGAYHTMALTANGNVYTWGRNTYGQLGNNCIGIVNSPARIEGIPPVKSISAGAFHSLAIGLDGKLYGWGNNTDGQLGGVKSEHVVNESDEILGKRVLTPAQIIPSDVAFVSGGGNFTICIKNDGFVYAWGNNDYGQLGDGTNESSRDPVKVTNIESAVQISAGFKHSLAVIEDEGNHRLFSWGDNSAGQLGLENIQNENEFVKSPREVKLNSRDTSGTILISLIDASYFNSLATVPDQPDAGTRRERDSVYVWGNNSYGQLGIGNMPSQYAPVKMIAESNGHVGDTFLPFQSVSGGGYHTVFLSVKGFLGTVGRADKGQLGNVSSIDRNTPVGIPVEDAISPEWNNTVLQARKSEDKVTLTWDDARDNIAVTGYELNYRNKNKEQVVIEFEEDINEYTIEDIDSTGQIITVFAIDEQGNRSTDPLVYFHEIENPFAFENNQKPVEGGYLANRLVWTPGKYGEIEYLEVPWDVDYIYGPMTVLPPRDYSWIYAILITTFVSAIFIAAAILAFKKNHKDIRIIGDIIRVKTKKKNKDESDKIDEPLSESNKQTNPEETQTVEIIDGGESGSGEPGIRKKLYLNISNFLRRKKDD